MSSVVVFGGLGYLGSVLCPKLKNAGYDVKIFDLNLFNNADGANVIIKDMRDEVAVKKALASTDIVICAAGIVGDPMSLINTRTTWDINYNATKQLAILAKEAGVKHFIFSSSCSVYGAGYNQVFKENSTLRPIDWYGVTKHSAEDFLKAIRGMPVAILRFATLFGLSPRMRFDLVVNKFIAKAITEHKVEVFGGQQHRPFTHVSDVADAIVLAIDKKLKGTYNVSAHNYSIIQMANLLKHYIPDLQVEEIKDISDPRDYWADSSKLIKKGWQPKKKIEDAIEEIRAAIRSGEIKDWQDKIYNNHAMATQDEYTKKVIYGMGL